MLKLLISFTGSALAIEAHDRMLRLEHGSKIVLDIVRARRR
jgi:hypothetical protein